MNGYRAPTPQEHAILDLLVGQEFPGCIELRQQAAQCEVRVVDEDGSLEFHVPDDAPAVPKPLRNRVPVEAWYCVVPGGRQFLDISLHALLHVNDAGMLHELEFYWDDGTPVGTLPHVDQWQVFIPYEK